jgi:hypothetical protein
MIRALIRGVAMKTLLGGLRLLTLLPAYLVYLRSDHTIIDGDIDRWQVFVGYKKPRHRAFFFLMRYYPEFRSLRNYSPLCGGMTRV